VASIPGSGADVVLLDMRLPRLSGLEVLRRLGAAGRMPPAIILTTFDDEVIVLEGLRCGARGYLLKDVSLEELVQSIRVVAGRRHRCAAHRFAARRARPRGRESRLPAPGAAGPLDRAR